MNYVQAISYEGDQSIDRQALTLKKKNVDAVKKRELFQNTAGLI